MKRKKLKLGTAVRVYWRDSLGRDGWLPVTQGNFEAGKVLSTGYVATTSEDALTISTSLATLSPAVAYDPLSIPWAAIVQLDLLGEEHDAK